MDAFTLPGFRLDAPTTDRLRSRGITQPTAVQTAGIPTILAGGDTMLYSGTGTGKTLAYVLPMLQRAAADSSYYAVIVAPSPELAMQITHEVEAYKNPQVGCVSLTGSGNFTRQKERLKKHPQVMVGTPGRILELWLSRKIKTAQVKTLVLDEVDEILQWPEARSLSEICSRPEFKAQVIFASATLGPRAQDFAQRFMAADRLKTQLAAQPLSSCITHWAVLLQDASLKEEALLALLNKAEIGQALIFVNKLFEVSQLYNVLTERGIKTAGLSSERNKQAREAALLAFNDGRLQALVSTQTAGRGIDFQNLQWVIHFDVPRDPETYLHRAGRVGRAGRTGHSVVLALPRDHRALSRVESAHSISFAELTVADSRRTA